MLHFPNCGCGAAIATVAVMFVVVVGDNKGKKGKKENVRCGG